MNASSKCPHFNFVAQVNVARIEDTGLKYAEITIRCTDCNKPAEFRGLPYGLSPDQPMASPDNREIRAPFLCEGDEYNGKGIGFTVRQSQ
jgi:hypothetical protein